MGSFENAPFVELVNDYEAGVKSANSLSPESASHVDKIQASTSHDLQSNSNLSNPSQYDTSPYYQQPVYYTPMHPKDIRPKTTPARKTRKPRSTTKNGPPISPPILAQASISHPSHIPNIAAPPITRPLFQSSYQHEPMDFQRSPLLNETLVKNPAPIFPNPGFSSSNYMTPSILRQPYRFRPPPPSLNQEGAVRFGCPPTFTTYQNVIPYPRQASPNWPGEDPFNAPGLREQADLDSILLNDFQNPCPSMPAPAHTGRPGLIPRQVLPPAGQINQPPMMPRGPRQPTRSQPTYQPRFVPQAAPVRTAYQDFFRHVESFLPNVDINQLMRQISTSSDQPIQIPVPNELNTIEFQQTLQNSLELSFMAPMLPKTNNSHLPPPLPETVHLANNFANNMIPNGKQVPRLPPSEDDMVRQDLDADANQDEEYQEVETYADYAPAKLAIGNPHPDPVVETSSLSTVEPPDITYKLKMPAKVIDNSLLSALQLESVIYASQQHNVFLADERTRRGFLIGDGAGVGKGRTIAGIIYENWLCGRRKSIWLSVSRDLKFDAERDLRDISAKIPVHILDSKFTYGRKINVETGVMFTTYSGLVSKSQSIRGLLGSRLGQLVSWAGSDFDGVIVFDECHKAKNITVDQKKKGQSKAAEFALEIQNKLPNARVVYASATGASETKHLGYMTRLGIWGKGTPFETFSDFCSAIEKRGVGAMELVAVDLKMRGSYIARQLSFKTTSFEIRVAQLDNAFIQVYDQSVDLWAKALASFQEASNYFSDDRKRSRTIWTSFWAAHQKFFKYLCIGAKVPLVIQIAQEALDNGKCVVIGLQSTGEAKTVEALDDGDINEFISTARATFESLVENHFPAPYKPRRSRIKCRAPEADTRTTELDQKLPSGHGEGSGSSSQKSSSSSSTTMDETYQGHDNVKFILKDGMVEARIEDNLSTNRLKRTRAKSVSGANSERLKALKDLALQKRKSESNKSKRAIRAKRRTLKRDKKHSRIKVVADDSDTEVSTALSSISADGLQTSSSSSATIKDSDSSYQDNDTEDVESTDDECKESTGSESPVGPKRPRNSQSRTNGSSSKAVLNSDSDSDIQIMAVKSKRRPEIIILSSDATDEEDLDNDNPLMRHGKRLTALKDELFRLLDELGPKLPNNTLDDLIDRLGGPTKVAEMTGRKGRVIKGEDGQISYRQRNDDDALENLNIAEKERFMSGEKFIAIISEAASSGISLQADKRVENKRRRVHITIELPWSADRAIQQFGRTHRSNQVSGPEYVFVISELAGEKRFASIVAKRLESLGALTHGDRRATTESRDLSQFNIVSRYCKQALDLVIGTIEREIRFAGIEPNYPRNRFSKDAKDAFVGAGLGRYVAGSIFNPDPQAVKINHFLNRLLGMKVGIQNALFKLFSDYMDRLITRKKVSGEYDSGILELNSESGKTRCEEPEHFYLKTVSDRVKCTLRKVKVERGISWEEALKLLEESISDTRSGFYVSTNPITKANMVYLLLREPQFVDQFRTYKPNMGRSAKSDTFSFLSEKGRKCKLPEAEKIWSKVYQMSDEKCIHLCFFNSCKRLEAKLKCDIGLRHRNYCILSGGILTAWPYLERKAPQVTTKLQIVRLKLDANNRVIGPIIPQDALELVRKILKKGEEGVEF